MYLLNKKFLRIDFNIIKGYQIGFAFLITSRVCIEFKVIKIHIYIRIGRWV